MADLFDFVPVQALIFLIVIFVLLAGLVVLHLKLTESLCFEPNDEEKVPGELLSSSEEDSDEETAELMHQANVVLRQLSTRNAGQLDDTIAAPKQVKRDEPVVPKVELTFSHAKKENRLDITILQVNSVPVITGGQQEAQSMRSRVLVSLLPLKLPPYKTASGFGTCPRFDEKVTFKKIKADKLAAFSLQLELLVDDYQCKDRHVGEIYMPMSRAQFDKPAWFAFSPPSAETVEKDASTVLDPKMFTKTTKFSEILIGLAYKASTGYLTVDIARATNIVNPDNVLKAPDVYIKAAIVNDKGEESRSSKTDVIKAASSPVFMSTFRFPCLQYQIGSVTLILSVYCVTGKKKVVGFICLGQNSSSDVEQIHWEEMLAAGEEVANRWHVLLPPAGSTH